MTSHILAPPAMQPACVARRARSSRAGNTSHPTYISTANQETRSFTGATTLACGIDSLYINLRGVLNEKNSVSGAELRTVISGIQISSSPGMLRAVKKGCFTISLYQQRPAFMPVACLQCHPHYLRNTDFDGVWQLIRMIGSACFWLPEYTHQVSRLDIFVDIQLSTEAIELASTDWISRAKKTLEPPGSTTPTLYFAKKGPLSARLYDKTAQLRYANDQTIIEEWKRNGWDGHSRVLRVEFQLRRKPLRKFGIDYVWNIPEKIDSAWDYLTKEWLRQLTPKQTRNKSRWPTHPTWQLVQDAALSITTRSVSCPHFNRA